MLRQVGGFTRFVCAFSFILACFAAGHVYAQPKPQEPASDPLPPNLDLDSLKEFISKDTFVCLARSEVYTKKRCDQSCTEECREIGGSLKKCDPPQIVACAR